MAWYLPTGIDAADCIAAYQAIGAESEAAARINQANPGTYDLTGASPPAWDADRGWVFAESSAKSMLTGVVATSGYSAFARIANAPTTGFFLNAYLTTQSDVNGANFNIYAYPFQGLQQYASGGAITTPPIVASGVCGIAGQQAFIDGTQVGGTIPGWSAISTQLYIGYPLPGLPMTADILAVVIFSTTLTSAQITELTASMNALPEPAVVIFDGVIEPSTVARVPESTAKAILMECGQ